MQNSTTDDKQPTQSTGDRRDNDFVERRRVIKGLASLPVILTLGNGSARANASAHQCLEKTPRMSEPACTPIDEADPNIYTGWVAEPVSSQDGRYRDEGDPEGDHLCVVYAQDMQMPGSAYDKVPYRVVDQNGDQIPLTNVEALPEVGNPLNVSCATSFMPPL